MKTINDHQLLTAFQQGEEKAVKQIFERFHKEMVSFATRLTGQIPEAQDIVIDAFLKTLPRASDFSSVEKIRAFLYVVVRHACYAWLEQQRSLLEKQKAFAYLVQEETKTGLADFAGNEEMITRTLHQLYEYLQQLPPQEKKVFIRKIIHQQPADEIANELNISKKTVYNLSSSAIARLRQWLGDTPYPEALLLFISFFEFFLDKQEY